jgi:hypothetical protein
MAKPARKSQPDAALSGAAFSSPFPLLGEMGRGGGSKGGWVLPSFFFFEASVSRTRESGMQSRHNPS